jgi:CubicO group peptidase (beta-lactamase class C family)
MFTIARLFFTALIVLISLFTEAQNNQPYSAEIKAFEKFLEQQMEADRIPGLSVGFYKEGFMWSGGYGYIDLENNVKATDQSAYRLASVTKTMTAVAVLQLQESGKLDIDDPVREYVPYFPRKRWDVTLRHLLGHIGGISHYQDYDEEGSIKVPKDTREAIDIFDEFELVARPGTEYNYSSYGYNLLGAAIEGASEMPYGKYLRNNIWEPLNMDHTWMDSPDKIIPKRAEGYRLVFGELKNSEYVNISSRFAAGGTRSTVVDMLKYARGLNRGKLLTEASREMMETSMNLSNGRRTNYGMGWHVKPVNGHYQVYHTGGQPETRTILMRFPAKDFAIALAYNLEGGSLRAIARHLYQLIMDEGWNVKPYAGNKYDQTLIDGMWDVYNYGMAYYEYRNKARTTDPERLSRTFDFVNNTLNPGLLESNFEEVEDKIALGIHPKARKAYVRLGSYMILKLIDYYGKERMDYYHKNGALALFKDFLELKEEEGKNWSLNPGLKEKINQFYSDWSKAWNDYTRQLYIGSRTDLDEILDTLNNQSEGRSIHPDYASVMANALFERFLRSDDDEAIALADKFISLYPESSVPWVTKGNLFVLREEKEKAGEAYRRGLNASMDRHAVSASVLNYYARRLFESDRLADALTLLDVAEKLYPESAILQKTRGDIYREKSKRHYKKSLELNPTLERSWEELEDME